MRHVMTLANSIIGVGILAMPFCFQKCGVLLSIVLLVLSNYTARVCCHYLIKTSLLTRRRSFEFLGFHAFGFSGKLLVELCMIGYLLGTCVTYFVVIGDLGPQIITKLFSLDNEHGHFRLIFMLVITLILILPLGLLKNVDSLAAVSTASIGFYICFIVKIFLESEEHLITNSWTDKVVYWQPDGILQCLPIFSMALSCQMQLFEVFETINNQSLEKLNGIVRDATWICTLVYISVGFFGYVAFCTQVLPGNILINFSTSFGSDVIKIGFVLSVAFSFPLMMFPCRASIYSLLYRKGHSDASGYIPETRFRAITVFIITFALCVAFMIPSVELIIGLVGSTIGVAICIMFPAACFRKIIKKETTERTLAQFILVCGFCLMVLGTFANLNAIDEKRSGAHLESAQIKFEEHLPRPTVNADLLQHKLEDIKGKFKINDAAIDRKPVAAAPGLEDVKRKLGNAQDRRPDDKVLELDANADAKANVPPALVQSINFNSNSNNNNNNNIEERLNNVKIEQPALEVLVKKGDALKVVSPMPESELNARDVKNSEADVKQAVEEVKRLAISESSVNGSLEGASPLPARLPQGMLTAEISLPVPGEQKKKDQLQHQSIDMDAIRNEDEVVAEESRNSKKANDKAEANLNAQELKETFARAVDKLKEELEKKNEETKNLVVERLGEFVEKVEQIERKVKQKEVGQKSMVEGEIHFDLDENKKKSLREVNDDAAISEAVAKQQQPEEAKTFIEIDNAVQRKSGSDDKPLLIDRLSNSSKDLQKEKAVIFNRIDEPLSYKTGELLELNRNLSRPLPLALLINASQIKTQPAGPDANDTNNRLTNTKLNGLEAADALKTNVVDSKPSGPSPVAQKAADAVAAGPDAGKENVEAIRRDILQLKTIKEATTVTSLENHFGNLEHRLKRELPAISADALEASNCLTEPKVESLLKAGASAVLDYKIQNIGRDLKSLEKSQDD